MENTVLVVLAVIAITLIAAYLPIVGLIAMAWASYKWLGMYAAIVITLFWVRYGGPLLPPGWVPWLSPQPPPTPK